MFGWLNHRASISRPRKGTQRLTTTMATITPNRKRSAIFRDHSSSSPVVFMTHQVAPSSP
jgi:hypothetical protein